MRVKDLMTTDVLTVRPSTPLKDAAVLLAERRISGLPVVDDENGWLGRCRADHVGPLRYPLK